VLTLIWSVRLDAMDIAEALLWRIHFPKEPNYSFRQSSFRYMALHDLSTALGDLVLERIVLYRPVVVST
jgi:hypothetical protein